MSAPDRWQRVGALFDRALATPPPERQSLVRSSTEPSDVQDEVLELLKSHDDSHGFLEPAALLANGTQVGAYRIERILGRGGMGVVYRARQLSLNRLVALKLLLLGEFSSEQSVQRFQREARAAAALRHPNIVGLHDVGEFEGQHYFTMELVGGGTLAETVIDSGL